ncbi:hypothetical protein IRY61_00085 [Candidatus Saccharibacteria bacterium]|uniref:hypothetical protein n=1 Tax=Heyndrickxia coagulans TaxID=1398 RepID=UPI0014595FFC|nr:hypothetical protein [Heyndrickxia coagulans]MBX6333727.1 hypothetical protein [Candidatus Saccharibacteria bacterium]NMH83284.1 hypothetical protein [Heyndrickxia coagulans]UZH06386.1 hypothetical protein ONG97_00120 [Heyndrickxia coagulans]
MSEKIEVEPTPIQRNLNDVAIELTKIYLNLSDGLENPEDLFTLYKKAYKTAADVKYEQY